MRCAQMGHNVGGYSCVFIQTEYRLKRYQYIIILYYTHIRTLTLTKYYTIKIMLIQTRADAYRIYVCIYVRLGASAAATNKI